MEDHHNIFLEHIRSYGPVSEAAAEDLVSKVSRVHREKGQRIIREGQVATSFFIVESGMVRSFYRKGTAEITVWFAYEGQIAVACSSLLDNKPSHETVECVEDCDLLCITGKDLRESFEKHECLNTIGRKMLEEWYGLLEDRVYSFQVMSATERYKALMEHEPEIIRRAPLRNIASFLGISQETLSRIRHNW